MAKDMDTYLGLAAKLAPAKLSSELAARSTSVASREVGELVALTHAALDDFISLPINCDLAYIPEGEAKLRVLISLTSAALDELENSLSVLEGMVPSLVAAKEGMRSYFAAPAGRREDK